jgi:hypothetical protein
LTHRLADDCGAGRVCKEKLHEKVDSRAPPNHSFEILFQLETH